jgi:threonine dehydratase
VTQSDTPGVVRPDGRQHRDPHTDPHQDQDQGADRVAVAGPGDGLVGLAEVRAARQTVAAHVHRTPTLSASTLGAMVGVRLALKAELFQKSGSFKVRGVLNALAALPPEQLRCGLVTLSAGNHAAALAMAAGAVGVPATVVMPATAAPSKVRATQAYGGEVVLTDRPLMEVVGELRDARGLVLVHPFDDPAIIAGAGTVGLEIVEDTPDVDTVVVPVGGGGLVSGIAAAVRALRPQARIVGVEPENADVMGRSLRAGRPVHLDGPISTVADGLAAPFAGRHTYRHVAALVDDVVAVGEDDLRRATLLLMERAKLYAEPAAAAPLAALLARRAGVRPGEQVVCVVSGGNVNADVLRAML